MALLADLEKSISGIISSLVAAGAADRLNMPSVQAHNKHSGDIGLRSNIDLSLVLRDQPYGELYDELVRREFFHVLLPDGGLLQFFYKVRLGRVEKHRLAFFPCPYLRPFDTDVLTYLRDSIWGHMVTTFHVPVIVRFDFDRSDVNFIAKFHSNSHLTLGQYPNCRIPVSSPIEPWIFAEFVLRNFYAKCFKSLDSRGIFTGLRFAPSLKEIEKKSYFLMIPDMA